MAHQNITRFRPGPQGRRIGAPARSTSGCGRAVARPTVSQSVLFGTARSEGVAGATQVRLSEAPVANVSRVRSILGRTLSSVTGANEGMAGGVVLVGLNDGEGIGRMYDERSFTSPSTDPTTALHVVAGVLGALVLTGALVAAVNARRRRTAISESAAVVADAARVAAPLEAAATTSRAEARSDR